MCSLNSIIILGNNVGAIQESIIESYCFCYNKLVWIKTIIINTMWICRNPTKVSLSSPKKTSYLKNQIPKNFKFTVEADIFPSTVLHCLLISVGRSTRNNINCNVCYTTKSSRRISGYDPCLHWYTASGDE